ncbi:hypothetical protein BE08_28520 [Sorangium cellulosum]|uniref:Uncharacterized protein n=1 Tax=Sorangium cellulosum TaxID=56 RepID=A0A150P9V2_SORCE|nr:hypothetical protein BE08_28520 [Sorangium cellulosum]
MQAHIELQPPAGVMALLRNQFCRWRSEPKHLGLEWAHYSSACPPLLFLGGRGVAAETVPLITVSIEPLRTHHFEAQIAQAASSIEAYVDWNWSYFNVFPRVVGGVVQPYWRNMVEFGEGWSSARIALASPWSSFGEFMIELPYVPMHAPRHVPRACRAAHHALNHLFVARVDALVDIWPDAMFVVLSSAVRRQLERAKLLHDLRPLDMRMSPAERDLYGNGFSKPVLVGRLATRARPRVAVRNGPFSHHTNPRSAGRRELGRRIRELVGRPE